MTEQNIKEFYHSEMMAARRSVNKDQECYYKELYKDAVMTELEEPYNMRCDKLPYYKFIYLN